MGLRSREDLVRRGALIEQVSRQGGGTIVIEGVGSDAMFALLRATTGRGRDNARAISLPPAGQADPDLYLHVVDEGDDSITVRRAKCHTSFSANADELTVLPTRAMGVDDADPDPPTNGAHR